MKLINLNMIVGSTVNEDEQMVETSKPVVVNGDAIRAFYARRDEKPGSRITFTDGGGFAVSETPEQVSAALAA